MSTLRYRATVAALEWRLRKAAEEHDLVAEVLVDESGDPSGLGMPSDADEHSVWEFDLLAQDGDWVLNDEPLNAHDASYWGLDVLPGEIDESEAGEDWEPIPEYSPEGATPQERFLQFVFRMIRLHIGKTYRTSDGAKRFFEKPCNVFSLSSEAVGLLLARLIATAPPEPFDIPEIVAAAGDLAAKVRRHCPIRGGPYQYPVGDPRYIESDFELYMGLRNASARLYNALNPDHLARSGPDRWHIHQFPIKGKEAAQPSHRAFPLRKPGEAPDRDAILRIWDVFFAHFHEPLLAAECKREGPTWKPGRLPEFEEIHLTALEAAATGLDDAHSESGTPEDDKGPDKADELPSLTETGTPGADVAGGPGTADRSADLAERTPQDEQDGGAQTADPSGGGGQNQVEPKAKKRPAYDRDHLFLEWYEDEGADTYHSHAVIRDTWNDMDPKERERKAPTAAGNVTRDTVITAVKTAKKERNGT